MRFLNLTDIAPQSFMKCLEKTSNVELLSTIEKLMLDTKEHFKNGIPAYGKKLSSDQECIEAKKELLSALLHEYQLRMCSLYNNGRMHLAEARVKKVKGSKDSEKIIDDVATLSTGTLSKLLKDQGINETSYQILDKIHQKFIQFTVGALDSAPSAYKNWMDAWKYFTDTYDLETLDLKSEASVTVNSATNGFLDFMEYVVGDLPESDEFISELVKELKMSEKDVRHYLRVELPDAIKFMEGLLAKVKSK